VTAPAGTEVGLYVDLRDRVAIGDIIETRSGRQYLVTSVRVQERGKHAGRQHLRAVVLDPEAVCPSAMVARFVHRIRWYHRGRASGGVTKR
jgi:hypothetical protein